MGFRDLYTENDGKTWCPVRVIGILGAAQFLINSQVQFVKTATMVMGYGTELALVIGAVGAAFALKSMQESKAPAPAADPA